MVPTTSNRFVPVALADTTLMDGEQTYGVVFSNFEKLQIARLIDSLPGAEIEAGFPAQGGPEGEYYEELVALKRRGGLRLRLVGWHRPEADSIE